MNFSQSLISWYLINKRDLPWRNTSNPYPIWLSEIMLQQTRVAQGLPYFNKFLEHFPTVFDLANASEEQVLKHWQGLGYYSRARNMHKTAQIIANDFNGIFPNNFSNLLKLKGVGEYTAAAIASFAYNEIVPVVDGNVYRVLSRYFNIETDIASSSAKKEFTALAKELIPIDKPALFNQAIMEFGALQCVPKNPNCTHCVLNNSCVALQKNKVASLPVKLKKTKVTERYFNYLIFDDSSNKTLLNKRIDKGIWHNLYEFPVIETESVVSEAEIIDLINETFTNYEISSISNYEYNVRHKLSHQLLTIHFYHVKVETKIANAIDFNTLSQFPVPVVIHKFIEKHLI
jgi:A/G-specific adenine glycosylase